MTLRIAIVVQGRFHAFDLARALLARGHDVAVFTNYPAWAAARFGVPADRVRSFGTHGAVTRIASRVGAGSSPRIEATLHMSFGRWAARELARERWDVIHAWSGVAEEVLRSSALQSALVILMRGSAHIAVQRRLLEEEEERAGVPIDRPSDWMCARERREYAVSPHIAVLSTFARDTFLAEGVRTEKVSVVPLGVETIGFRPIDGAVAARRARILSGEPLRVLFVGALSYQKGILDLIAATNILSGDPFRFQLVGQEVRESTALLSAVVDTVTITGKVPQSGLSAIYQAADLFLFPTIQDGFGLVLAQAKAAGLPIITTAHSAGPDMLTAGADGWIVPIRDVNAIVERLRWCDQHRPTLADMVDDIPARYQPRDWSEVAEAFEVTCVRLIEARRRGPVDATRSTDVASARYAATTLESEAR